MVGSSSIWTVRDGVGPGLTTVPRPFSVFCFLALFFREIRDLSPRPHWKGLQISPDRVGNSTSVATSNVHFAGRKNAASVRFGVVRLDRNEVSPPVSRESGPAFKFALLHGGWDECRPNPKHGAKIDRRWWTHRMGDCDPCPPVSRRKNGLNGIESNRIDRALRCVLNSKGPLGR